MKKIGMLSIIALASLFVLTACGSDSTSKDTSSSNSNNSTTSGDLPASVQKIKDNGVLKVGVKEDVPNFGYMNPDTNKNEGMEIDVAKLIAKDIFGDESKVQYTGVTAKTRGPLLDNGEVDMIIATFTITDERKETYNFTVPYYKDEIGFLVRKDDKFTDMKSLDGKTIGVAQSATTKQSLEEEAKKLGISFKFLEFASYPELKTALTSKRIDAFSVDKSILTGYVDKNTEILKDGFSPQEYGIATKKSNADLNDYLDGLIDSWEADGTLEKINKQWGLN